MKKKISLALLALTALSCAQPILRDNISRNQRDIYTAKSYMPYPVPYHGFDFGLSNHDKDTWLNIGFYDGKPEGVEHSTIIFPRTMYTPFSYCLWNCESKVSRLEFEARFGVGLELKLDTKIKRIQISELAAELLGEITVPELDLDSEIKGISELSARFGYIEGRYSLLMGKEMGHLLSIGTRF